MRVAPLKVLVTGGSGFIGTHLVDLLIKKGYQVRVLDRRVPKVPGVEWMDGDLRWLGAHQLMSWTHAK